MSRRSGQLMEGIVIGMIFYIVGNGSGEGLYDDNAFYADADPCAVQAWADEWVRSLPDDKRDRFDDVDPSKVQEALRRLCSSEPAAIIGESEHGRLR